MVELLHANVAECDAEAKIDQLLIGMCVINAQLDRESLVFEFRGSLSKLRFQSELICLLETRHQKLQLQII